ncbi:MAG: alpha/beta hydrolase [Chloroflexota bacterium]|nr:alpha/beta hydrolase [Chloroflexota bacterium]
MSKVTSRDGTSIAFERSGEGPVLVLVDGAMSYRSFGPMAALAEVLTPHFTVYTYDRRGRGESGDTAPYAVAREVEDLEALIAEAGDSAYVCGLSSGAVLALEAAASGLAITKLALYEPPFTVEGGDLQHKKDYTERLEELLSADRRGDAVEWFLTSAGMPAEAITGMRNEPVWPLFEAIAPTLAYDNAVLGDGTVSHGRAAKVTVPTLVADGGASPDFFRRVAKATAAAIPGARYRTLEGQTWGRVAPESLALVLKEFLL